MTGSKTIYKFEDTSSSPENTINSSTSVNSPVHFGQSCCQHIKLQIWVLISQLTTKLLMIMDGTQAVTKR